MRPLDYIRGLTSQGIVYSEFSGCCPAPAPTEEVYIPPSPDELYFEECAAIMEYNLEISQA